MKRYATAQKDIPKPTMAKFVLNGRVKSKKNSKEIAKRPNGQMFVRSSDSFKAWENTARYELLKQKIELQNQGWVFPFEGRLRLELRFEMIGLKHEPDVSNLIEGPQDLLQELDIIKNDKHIVEVHAVKFMDQPADITFMTLSKSLEV